MKTPTEESYRPFEDAYSFFNQRLFGGELPDCLITFQRQKRIMGYVSLERWVNNQDEYKHELAINPEYFANYPLIEICQTLCHEMVHVWQAKFGSPGRRGYHNLEWANKMIAIGLMPSTTGEPGGDIIGEHVADYILFDGAFKMAFDELTTTGFQLTWMDRYPVARQQVQTVSYTRLGAKVQLDPPAAPIKTMAARNSQTDIAVQTAYPLPYSFEELDAAFTATLSPQLPPALPMVPTTKPRNSSNKHKYRCPMCHLQLWGKPELYIICGECNKTLLEIE